MFDYIIKVIAIACLTTVVGLAVLWTGWWFGWWAP